MSKLTSAQLAIVLQKQLTWKQSGIKTGSGKDFDIERVCNSIKSTSSKESKPTSITKNGKKNKKRKSASNELVDASPHATRLQWLLKNGDTTSEHYHQVRYLYILERFEPEIYEDMCGIPMGDLRVGLAGARIQAEGAKKGSPDLNYDLPRGKYHGLRIEMKRPAEKGVSSGKLSAIQIKRMNRARHNGYYVTVCYGFMEALFVVWEYNALRENEEMRTRAQDHSWINN
ncbi:hypothetical protein ACEUAI_22880 [Aeromonas veronii]